MAAENGANPPAAVEEVQAASKPKRVRTGCLTCRERHLKCDEAMPHCQNCRKSNRICKRGIRLNFIDTQVQQPPVLPISHDWSVVFQDESREIASEYKDGLERYAALEVEQPQQPENTTVNLSFASNGQTIPAPNHHSLPPIQGILPDAYAEEPRLLMYEPPREPQHHSSHPLMESSYAPSTQQNTAPTSFGHAEPSATPVEGARDWLDNQEEVLFMQVFVEEVGLWMDSMDPNKHFSRLLPFHALSEPMLLNAFLACGARHLSLVNPKYTEDKALHYYDTATRYLLNSLQNPNRDTVICATTAVILNVYEIMCERALQRMNHIAGARALIKECGWNARSTGVGAACFWLNVGMELLSCLHFNWQVAWDPDDWGLDMNLSREMEPGREELWTYRIVYIVAKIANFRASSPRFHETSPRNGNDQIRLQNRYNEWKRLKDMTDTWNENIPRTMHPLAYLFPGQTISQSSFPEVWLIKRTTIVARLFYHTAMVLLAQTNPLMSREMEEMRGIQESHSQQICGIVAHVKDRGVASVALRSLAIAGECLTDRRQQDEVLQILDKIRQETGWRVAFINRELKESWGRGDDPGPPPPPPPSQAPPQPSTTMVPSLQPTSYPQTVGSQITLQPQPITSLPPAPAAAPASPQPQPQPQPQPTRQRPPPGILNPLLAAADFSMPQHPYQSYYVAPNPVPQQLNHQSQFSF